MLEVIILVIVGGLFMYVSTVVIHEEKTGKRYRMFWE